MYVRVSQAHFDPSREQETLQFIEEQIVPAVRQLPGFRRYTAAGERTTGRGVLVTEWDDLEHAQALPSALSRLTQEGAHLGIQTELGQAYEVLVQA